MTVLVEVVRSGFVESVHHGSLVVTAPDGSVRVALGDLGNLGSGDSGVGAGDPDGVGNSGAAGAARAVTAPGYPRSSNKPLQATGMLRAGLDVDDEDLALVCGSHSGEPEHVRRVLAMLGRVGLSEDALCCPPERPGNDPAASPRKAAMNCSGKHAGMLAACLRSGWAPGDYTHPDHELQRTIVATAEELTGEQVAHTGVDGCGAPLLAFSLTGLARAFGRIATATSEPEHRVARAMRARPWLVGGTGRDDTLLMLAVEGLLVKGGAEGVHALALPDGTAAAFKIADGASRARGPVLAALLRGLGAVPDNPAAASVVNGFAHNAGEVLGGGRPQGGLRVSTDVAAALGTPS